MKKEIYTIAVMSFLGRPPRTFSISRISLIIISISLASFFVASIGLVSLKVWNSFQKQARETETAIQKYDALQNDFQKLQSELANIRESYRDFKTILGFGGIVPVSNVENIKSGDKETLGKGGPPEEISVENEVFEVSDESIGNLKADINFALREVISLKSDLDYLIRNTNSKFAKLAAIPSICPIIVDPGKQYCTSSDFGLRISPFGINWEQHGGLDIVALTGTPVIASADGIITGLGQNQFLGNFVAIRHSDKYTTIYGHLNDFASGITTGTRIKRYDLIGYVGNTGRSTGSHLHYSVRDNGQSVNPLDYILN